MLKYGILGVFVLALSLAGCGSEPYRGYPDNLAYWSNPAWQTALLNAVQSAVHTPTSGPEASKHGIHATVRFLFADGTIENPIIVTSTGDADLDKLLLQQVASAKVPTPWGPHADEPHEFELPLDIFTPFEAFQYSVYTAIDNRKTYSRNALLNRLTGLTTIDFDYADNAAHNIAITKSSGNRELDKLSLGAVATAKLPAAPVAYSNKTVHMEVIFCYNINNTPTCPSANNIIKVRGLIFRRGY